MRSLELPVRDARSVLELCAKHVRDKAYALRLHSVAAEVANAEIAYKAKGQTSALFTIDTETSVGGRVTATEMSNLYTGTFSGKRSPVRYIYDDLKAAPRNGICPLCGQRVVSTLDHYLAKSLHPALAITPMNLVPACADCNKAKSDLQPTSASEQTLHPYFDKADDDTWLVSNVKETNPTALIFLAVPPITWPDLKRQRMISHFRVFGLGRLYSAHAAQELLNIGLRLGGIAGREGRDGLQRHLIDCGESYKAVARNSWQVAMYDALAKSDWFCNEGYKLNDEV